MYDYKDLQDRPAYAKVFEFHPENSVYKLNLTFLRDMRLLFRIEVEKERDLENAKFLMHGYQLLFC